MSLDIGAAIEDGLSRTLTRNAAILMGVFALLSVVSTVFAESLVRNLIEQGFFGEVPAPTMMAAATPLALDIPTAVSGLMLTVVSLLSTVVTIGAVRVFVSDETEAVPTDYFTDNILWVLANVVVGGLVFAVVLSIGFVAFIIPGFFLLSALYFWNFYVIDQGQNFFEAMKSSWRDTQDNRLRTLALLLIVLVASGVFSFAAGLVLGLIGTLVAGSAGNSLLTIIPSVIITVFSLATFTEAYKQIRQ